MEAEETETQPPLTLHTRSFTRGEVQGKPCVVIYDAATDKTEVIGFQSKNYERALMAITMLEVIGTPVAKTALNSKTAIAMPKKSRLILPGSNVSN